MSFKDDVEEREIYNHGTFKLGLKGEEKDARVYTVTWIGCIR